MKRSLMQWTVLVFALSMLTACGGGGGGGGGTGGGGGGTIGNVVVTTFSAPSTAVAGTNITVSGTLQNQGGALSAAFVIIYLSPNSNVTVDGGQLGNDVYWGFLGPGQSWNFSLPVRIPPNIANGTYYLSAVAQGDDPSVGGDNVWNPPVSVTITGGTTCSSDPYEADNLYAAAGTLAFAVTQHHNYCEGTSDWLKFTATAGTVYGVAAARTGSNASPVLSIYGTDGTTLLPSASSGGLVSRVTWTAPANGTYYIKAAPWNGVASGGANTEYDITYGDLRPDLIVSSFTAASTGLPGGIIWASDTAWNQGFVSAGTFTVSVYLSTDSAVTTSDTLLGSRMVSSLGVDQSSYRNAEYTLPAPVTPGQYYLAAIVNPTGSLNELTVSNNTSTVRPITVQAVVGCSQDAYEPDNSALTTNTTITVGAAPQQHNHCTDGQDWIKVPMTNGHSYAIRVARSNLSSAWVELYGTDGTTRLAGDWQYGTTAIDYATAAPGTYYLKVGGTAGNGTDYTVQVQEQFPDLVETLTLSNGTTVPAGGFLNVTDMVSNVGYLDAGPFEIGFYYSTSSGVTTADSLGATRSITGLPSSGYQSQNQSWMNYVHFPKSLPTGTYYLAAIADRNNAITEVNETNNASQALAITVTAPSCAWDAYEDDDDVASAKAIASGETQTRNFCDDDIDWVKFTPSASGMFVVSATNSVFFEPYESDGTTRVATHDTYFYSKFSLAGTAGHAYYLKGFNGNGGAYQLTVFQCTQDAYEDDDTLAAAKPIAVNETQARNHCEDRYDWAKFTAVGGTSYTITTTNGQNVYLTLYDGVSPYSLASGQQAQGGKLRVINWTAPATGTYYIEMDRFEFGQNTDYTLNLK